jgi:hypothetical protein
MSIIKKILFVLFATTLFTLLTPSVFAGNTQPIFNEPEPVYHTIYPNMLNNTTLLPASTKNYYKEIRQKVDSVLKKKIKKKLYNEVFREDLLQEIYDENNNLKPTSQK